MTSDFEVSFYSCDVPHGHTVTVKAAETASYTYVEEAAKRIAHIITVTAKEFCRAVVRVLEFCRATVFSSEAAFNREVFTRVGGLRL